MKGAEKVVSTIVLSRSGEVFVKTNNKIRNPSVTRCAYCLTEELARMVAMTSGGTW